MLRIIAVGAILWLAPSAAPTPKMTFEVYELEAGGGRKLLGQGVRQYSPSDIRVVDEGPTDSGHRWSKALLLYKAFEIEAQVYREQTLDGFGLVVQERGNPGGFSWEWFDRDQGDVFTKLQGTGRLKVTLAKSEGQVELAGIEFLDDVTLRFQVDMRRGKPGTHTHEIVVKKGSVFSFPPPSRPTKE